MFLAKTWSGINDGSLSILLRTGLEAENKREWAENKKSHKYYYANCIKHYRLSSRLISYKRKTKKIIIPVKAND